jgi:phospholipid/cholesterol/gamma-HCH transport system substrate-binding protein
MGRGIGRGRALANAGFVIGVLALSGFGMSRMASRQWRLQKTFTVKADFGTVGGVGEGHRVRLQGIDAGVVEAVVPPSEPGKPVRLVFRVDERMRPLIRDDARARIIAEGVVGAKVVEIVPGRADAPPLGPSGVIASERSIEVSDLMAKASVSLDRLNRVAIEAEQGLGEMTAVVASIRKGEGTLGKLVRDDEAYRKLVSLSTRGERTLDDLEENLAALKRTWPLSRYFAGRAFFDRDLVLFHPGSTRESRTFREDELFEPGRSALTTVGRVKLDGVASWYRKSVKPSSEVVIAAFTDDPREADLALLLTQEQAESVRKYLVSKHSIDSAGWFSTRKVAAVGFGTEVPRTVETTNQGHPSRRVEIILFTPQA